MVGWVKAIAYARDYKAIVPCPIQQHPDFSQMVESGPLATKFSNERLLVDSIVDENLSCEKAEVDTP